MSADYRSAVSYPVTQAGSVQLDERRFVLLELDPLEPRTDSGWFENPCAKALLGLLINWQGDAKLSHFVRCDKFATR